MSTEDQRSPVAPIYNPQYIDCLKCKRNLVHTCVLRALAADAPRCALKVHFIPRHSRGFLAALTSQDEEADDCAKVAVAALVPDRRQFCVREHPVARNFIDSLAGADNRVRVGQPFGNRPCVEGV